MNKVVTRIKKLIENGWKLDGHGSIQHIYTNKIYSFRDVMRFTDDAFEHFLDTKCIYEGTCGLNEEEYTMIFSNPESPKPSSEDIQMHVADLNVHISNVAVFMDIIAHAMAKRATKHDASKFTEEEMPYYAKYTPNLKGLTYGSEDYRDNLKKLKPAIDHHYANNSHHPEHYKNGLNDMDLVDIVEMICDWKSASMRHNDGNINKSLDINKERFGMDDQLFNILKNTIDRYFNNGL